MDNNGSNNPNQPSPFPPAGDPLGAAPTPSQGAPLPDPMAMGGIPPADPSVTPTTPIEPAPSETWPAAPAAPGADLGQSGAALQPLDTNPFLQQSPTPPGMFEAPTASPVAPTDPSQLGMPAAPQAPADSAFPANPAQVPASQDPLNTAFTPSQGPAEPNPFNMPSSAPADPVGAAPTPAIPDFMNPNIPAQQPNPVADMATGTSLEQGSSETPNQALSSNTSFGQSTEAPNAAGTIDLSAVQSTDTQAPPAPGSAPMPATAPTGMPLPETGPNENAPTDLSHLIAGEGEHQAPGDIYTPPVAPDQNPSVSQPQTSAQTGADGAPPEKHLNITKVLLVAGIPILLIVAALSAYLILGIGKPATSPEPTPLPIQQTQAPLTNPPQQIADPSPVVLPSPTTSAVFEVPSSSSSATLPGSSPSPMSALEQLRSRSASPSPTSSTLP